MSHAMIQGRYSRRGVFAKCGTLFAALFVLGLGVQSAQAQLNSDEMQRSIWSTTYTSLGGQNVSARVVFNGSSGHYDIPGGRGSLSNIHYQFSNTVFGNATITGNWSLGGTHGKFTFFVSGTGFSGVWQANVQSGNWSGRYVGLLPAQGGGMPMLNGGFSIDAFRGGCKCGACGAVQRVTYGPWSYNHQKGYYYRKCSFPGGGHQYVIYYKHRPAWVYWYNPVKRVFWCACPTVNHPRWGNSVRSGQGLFLVATTPASEVEHCRFPDPSCESSFTTQGTTRDLDGSTVDLGVPPSDLP